MAGHVASEPCSVLRRRMPDALASTSGFSGGVGGPRPFYAPFLGAGDVHLLIVSHFLRIQSVLLHRTSTSLVVLLASIAVLGCERALFPPNAQRTPYERYQVLRGKYRKPTETNVFGGDQPALRQRLQPLHRP